MQVDTAVIVREGISVGTLVRDWRSRRRLSQMELALDVGISPRHLSFVETGRSRPSADLLMTLAARLEVPLRERNRMLLSSGYAPRYSQQPLQARDMQPVRAALQRLLELHQPYPGLVLDRQWNVVLANDAALSLTALLPPALREPSLNIFRASLHPQGLSR
jgi:transcriptional regulator with XRE-family HTH domain